MSNKQQPPQPEAVQIEIDWSDEPMPVYANGAQIIHSHREFAIGFTDFAPFAGRRPKPYPPRPGEVHERARVVSSLRMAPDVFFQLLVAGVQNWNKFAETFTPPGQTLPTFKIEGAPPQAGGEAE